MLKQESATKRRAYIHTACGEEGEERRACLNKGTHKDENGVDKATTLG